MSFETVTLIGQPGIFSPFWNVQTGSGAHSTFY